MTSTHPSESAGDTVIELDVAIVGAGFAGLYALHRIRQLGVGVRVIEAGTGVGGTWFWNRYPGARCDVPSLEYSYSFDDDLQQDWHWSERYAGQPELERYLNHVADRYDLRRDIDLGQRVVDAQFDSDDEHWRLTTDRGSVYRAPFCLFATGGYSTPLFADFPGLDTFAGEVYHTALWPTEDVSFEGKRIGVIGTGSSGMQVITEVAKTACTSLTVFQRTPNYSVPANNQPMDPDYEAEFKRRYKENRLISRKSSFGVGYPVGSGRTIDLTEEEFQARVDEAMKFGGPALLTAFPDFLVDEDANYRVSEYLRSEVRRRVNDPDVAEVLSAKTHYLGARRLLVEQGYLESYNQPQVTLVDVSKAAIERITPTSLVTSEDEYELDMIILATGFDSGSGTMLRINPRALGRDLREQWQDGPETYLGMMVDGFPNMFLLYAPGSPGIRAQGVLMGEIQSDWIAEVIEHMRAHGLKTIEPLKKAAVDWTSHVADVAASGLVMRNDTTYVGANIPGKPRVYAAYLGGVGFYDRLCCRIREDGYVGFAFSSTDGSRVVAGEFTAPKVSDIRVSAI